VPRGTVGASLGSIVFEVIFQGVLMSIVSLIAFNRAIAVLGASRGAVFASLVPALAALLAVPVLGERPNLIECGGIVLVSLGVFLGSGAFAALSMRKSRSSRQYRSAAQQSANDAGQRRVHSPPENSSEKEGQKRQFVCR